jgi:hypothetical protein
MIEVKQTTLDRRSINLETDVSPGQRNALNAIVRGNGVALLAIGQAESLYIHSWRAAWLHYQWNQEYRVKLPAVLKLNGPSLLHRFEWTGPRAWKTETLYDKVLMMGQLKSLPFESSAQFDIEPSQTKPSPFSEKLTGSAST